MNDRQAEPVRDPVEKVLSEFDGRKETLQTLCDRTKNLIDDCLQDAGLRYQSVQARVKKREKLRQKYLDEKRNYTKLDDITDQAALRVITYYEDELDRVAEVIRDEFKVVPEKSIDKRESEPDRFGYYALNYVCEHLERRLSDVQFKKYAKLQFEIQITSILRHAWSEIEHEWYDLKDAYPGDIKRRFYRQAALLEIAESEFLTLRNLKSGYAKSIALQVETEVPELPLDLVSMRSFIKQEPLVLAVDRNIVNELGGFLDTDFGDHVIESRLAIAELADFHRVQDLRDAVKGYQAAVLEYVRASRELWGTSNSRFAPGVCIFHICLMLIARKGPDEIMRALRSLGVTPTFDLGRQAANALKVLAKYDG